MSPSSINRYWFQLAVVLTLCLLCLLTSSAAGLDMYDPYDEDMSEDSEPQKRSWTQEGSCRRCLQLFSSEDCIRCFSLEPSVIPFHAAKRTFGLSAKRGMSACFCCQHFRSTTHPCCVTCYKAQRFGRSSYWSK